MPDKLSKWVADRFDPDDGSSWIQRRSRLVMAEGVVSIVLNILLAGAKVLIGVLTGSIALIVDSVHSLSDCISSGVVVFGGYISRRPPDEEHPFGHGRAEYVASMFIGIFLGVAAIEFGKESIQRIMEPTSVNASPAMIALVGVLLLAKIWNTLFAQEIAIRTKAQSVTADFWHHLSDVIATVMAMVGMSAGLLGLPAIDGYMGVGVCLVLVWAAWEIAKKAVSSLIGTAPSEEELDEIVAKARAVDGVRNIHDVVVHHYGELRLVSLHVEVSSDMTCWQAHSIAEQVQNSISGVNHGNTVAHIDPVNDKHPKYLVVQDLLSEIFSIREDLLSFHDLRLVGDDRSFAVIFDLIPARDCEDSKEVLEEFFFYKLSSKIENILQVSISVEPAHNLPVN